jgi:hypothetical protein
MRSRDTSISILLLVACLTFNAGVQANEPRVSVPSTPDSTGQVTITGSAIAPLTNVTVRFVHSQAVPIDIVAQTTVNGVFALKFQPPVAGGYAVTVYDSTGQVIGQGRFALIR